VAPGPAARPARRLKVYRNGAGIDHHVQSLCRFSSEGLINVIGLHRHAGDPDISRRECRLLHFLHDKLGRLIGPTLAPAAGAGPVSLGPRLRQTLELLLQGASEKAIAARLGLSPLTVHHYISELYRN
jgi:DNA-binding NarL/FixJ family response regulator